MDSEVHLMWLMYLRKLQVNIYKLVLLKDKARDVFWKTEYFVFILGGHMPKKQVLRVAKNTHSCCVDGDACDRECIQTHTKQAADKRWVSWKMES